MGTRANGGFTIIETMLFLGISGLLIVGMLATTGASINIQRYHDAVETFKTLIQNQYSELTSVQNDRDNTWDCNSLAQSQTGGTEVRGQSDCVLLGRYLTVVDSTVSAYSVLGRPNQAQVLTGNDIQKLSSNYELNISTVTQDVSTLEWGTRIAWPKVDSSGANRITATTPRSIAMLFVRSPDSGQIYTFTSDTVPGTPTPQTLNAMLVGGATIPGQSQRTICVDSNGLFVTADFSIFINDYATGPSSIESRSNDYIKSIGGATKC